PSLRKAASSGGANGSPLGAIRLAPFGPRDSMSASRQKARSSALGVSTANWVALRAFHLVRPGNRRPEPHGATPGYCPARNGNVWLVGRKRRDSDSHLPL